MNCLNELKDEVTKMAIPIEGECKKYFCSIC